MLKWYLISPLFFILRPIFTSSKIQIDTIFSKLQEFDDELFGSGNFRFSDEVSSRSLKLTQPDATLFLSKSIWTCPQGPHGSHKITFFFSQMKLFSFCAKIAPKRHKLQKSSKLKKKCQKNLVFFDFFESYSFWGQY